MVRGPRSIRQTRHSGGVLSPIHAYPVLNVIHQERHRIDVDCRRTDRTQPLFASPVTTPSASQTEKERPRYSTISPNISDIGAQSPSNEHIDRLAGILLTYNLYEKELGSYRCFQDSTSFTHTACYKGYVQGMSDMCAPLYVVMASDEELTFWCFVEFMERMVRDTI